MQAEPAYTFHVAFRAWLPILWILSAAAVASVAAFAGLAALAGDGHRVASLVAAAPIAGTILVLTACLGTRAILNRTAILRSGGYRQPLRVTTSLGALAGPLGLAVLVTGCTAGLALAYYGPWLIHRLAGSVEAEAGTRPAHDDHANMPPPAARRLQSTLAPAALLPRALVAAGVAALGLGGLVAGLAGELAVLEPEPGGTPEAAKDMVLLYGALASVYLSAVTLGFARHLLAFAMERLEIVTDAGAAVPVTVHTGTGRKLGHYLGFAVLVLVTFGGFGMAVAAYLPHAFIGLLRSARGLGDAAEPAG